MQKAREFGEGGERIYYGTDENFIASNSFKRMPLALRHSIVDGFGVYNSACETRYIEKRHTGVHVNLLVDTSMSSPARDCA